MEDTLCICLEEILILLDDNSIKSLIVISKNVLKRYNVLSTNLFWNKQIKYKLSIISPDTLIDNILVDYAISVYKILSKVNFDLQYAVRHSILHHKGKHIESLVKLGANIETCKFNPMSLCLMYKCRDALKFLITETNIPITYEFIKKSWGTLDMEIYRHFITKIQGPPNFDFINFLLSFHRKYLDLYYELRVNIDDYIKNSIVKYHYNNILMHKSSDSITTTISILENPNSALNLIICYYIRNINQIDVDLKNLIKIINTPDIDIPIIDYNMLYVQAMSYENIEFMEMIDNKIDIDDALKRVGRKSITDEVILHILHKHILNKKIIKDDIYKDKYVGNRLTFYIEDLLLWKSNQGNMPMPIPINHKICYKEYKFSDNDVINDIIHNTTSKTELIGWINNKEINTDIRIELFKTVSVIFYKIPDTIYNYINKNS
jgi:hypothetical protein